MTVDGRDIQYTKWYSGEPNNKQYGATSTTAAHDEDGIEIRQGSWNDLPTHLTSRVICSVDIAGWF